MTNKQPFDKNDWITGLEKGIRVIEAFNDAHPRLTPSTAARRTGISRTAARRYLLTLEYLGYVESDGHHFWLTPRVLRLGWAYFDSAKLPRAVQPHLQRISVALGGAAFLAVLDDEEVLFVARDGSSLVQNVGYVLGARISAHVSAAGIAMLSCLSSEDVDHWLAGRRFIQYSSYTTTSTEGVRETINNARKQGYAVLEQQLTLLIRGVAVPIRNREGRLLGAISVSLHMGSETLAHALARALPVLREAEYALRAAL